MLLKTLFNSYIKYKNFAVSKTIITKVDELEIHLKPRKNSKAICSQCANPSSCYDRLGLRRFEFVPFWGKKVFLVYQMRRVDCKKCNKVVVEQVPWAEGKKQVCKVYELFLSHWAKRLSWWVVAKEFKVGWHTVYRAVESVVEYGLEHRDLSGIRAIGVDEIYWSIKKGFLTLVYQLDGNCRRLLYISERRTVRSLLGFFRMLGKERSLEIKFICSDMWAPYLKVIKKKAGQAIHILDRFHIVRNLNKAVNEVRIVEARSLAEQGNPLLKNSKYSICKNKENLTEKQGMKLKELLKINLKTIRAYLLKEEFQLFWEYSSPAWANKFLDEWTRKVMRSRIDPLKKFAKSIRKHQPLIINWFKAKKEFSSGIVEGLNNKTKVAIRNAYGYSTYKVMEIALFHKLGDLPEPQITHRFW